MKWQEVVKKYPEANFLQSPAYGKMNELLGAKVLTEDFEGQGYALMVVREAKRGRYLEISCGPLTDWSSSANAKDILAKIQQIAKQNKCVFIRIRPQLPADSDNLKMLEDLGLKKSPMHLAAEHTVMIDLTKSEDDLLAEMRRQTRYEVRRSAKLGIKVVADNSEQIFKEFHKVQLETARRQNFVPPSLKTLLAEREAFGKDATIYVAETTEGEKIAYGLVICGGKEGDYYEAADLICGELRRQISRIIAMLE